MSSPCPPAPLLADPAAPWLLDRSIDFLNHGSFGARLRRVWDAQRGWRERFESQPLEFFDRQLAGYLAEAKDVVGRFLGMAPDDFGFTTNVTDSICTVLRSLRFGPGDEVVTTDHVYQAVRLGLRHLVASAGAVVREAAVPLPCPGPDAVVDSIRAALSERTRLVIVDHVTSATALCFPVERIAALCRERGVLLAVDGAHAPGMLEVRVAELGADYYGANLHKWVCAPPGAGFLWVRGPLQAEIHPSIISHFLGQGMAAEFAWQGSRDVSPWLAAADAVRCMDELIGPGSWPAIRAHNHALAVWVQAYLCEAWDVEPSSAAHGSMGGSMLGSMVAVPLPRAVRERFASPAALQQMLYGEHRIEVPCYEWAGRWLVRPCCQVYNRAEQYERLARVIQALL